MEWLKPWWSNAFIDENFQTVFCRQLARELPQGHVLENLPVRVLARGQGDDVLFEILDGSGRVAQVHMTWSQQRDRLPWPLTSVYPSLDVWREEVMVPDHDDWASNKRPE